MQALILGCGYLGTRVAELWRRQGHQISVVTRSPERSQMLAERGFQTVVADVADPLSLTSLPLSDLVLYAVGYDRTSGLSRNEVVVDGLANVLRALAGKSRRIVFISTTSVYEETDGRVVDERTKAEPAGESGRLARKAELLVAESSFETIILRLSGLYGPGRLLRRVDQMFRHTPISGSPDAWMNLIHVEDAAKAVVLAADRLLAERADPGRRSSSEMYLVSDDSPLQRLEYYAMLARAAAAPGPLFDPSAGSRISGLGKRCRNDHAKQSLKLALQYPRVTEDLLREMLEPPSRIR